MVDLVYYLTNSLFFDVPLLYYYINLRLLTYFCLPSGDTYLPLGIYLSCSFVIVSELFCGELLETSISNFITNKIISSFCCFLNYSF